MGDDPHGQVGAAPPLRMRSQRTDQKGLGRLGEAVTMPLTVPVHGPAVGGGPQLNPIGAGVRTGVVAAGSTGVSTRQGSS